MTPRPRVKSAWIFLTATTLLVAVFFPRHAGARISVSPGVIRVSLDRAPANGSFSLMNSGGTPERYRARVVHFRFSEDGGLLLVDPDEYSLTRWLRFNPTEFDVPPGAKRVIRYTILAPRRLQAGEYWGGIEFEPVASGQTPGPGGGGGAVRFLEAAIVPIFGTRGKMDFGVGGLEAAIERKETGHVLNVRVRNVGLGGLDVGGRFELIHRTQGRVAEGELPRSMLLRGATRTFRLALSPGIPDEGNSLRLHLEAKQLERPFEAELAVALVDAVE